MVARHDEHVGPQGFDPGQGPIEFLDPPHFLGEIAVFTGGIGVLEVQEEEVELLPVPCQLVDLLVE